MFIGRTHPKKFKLRRLRPQGAACESNNKIKTICKHVAPLELEDRRAEFFYTHRAPNGALGNAASCFLPTAYRFARRVSGQKLADNFLNDEG
jgi:hypothetical protein